MVSVTQLDASENSAAIHTGIPVPQYEYMVAFLPCTAVGTIPCPMVGALLE